MNNTELVEQENFTCFACKENFPVKTEGGVRYGLDLDENKICYNCCAIRDKKRMDETGKAILYLTKRDKTKELAIGSDNYTDTKPVFGFSPEWEVSNWPGSLRFPATVRRGSHNITGTRYDAWFTDHNGHKWHGVVCGDMTQLCHCKRLKVKT